MSPSTKSGAATCTVCECGRGRTVACHDHERAGHRDRGHDRDDTREHAADAHVARPAAQVVDRDRLGERDPSEPRQLVFEAGLEVIHRVLPLSTEFGGRFAERRSPARVRAAERVAEAVPTATCIAVGDFGFAQARRRSAARSRCGRAAGATRTASHSSIARSGGRPWLGGRHAAQRALLERGAPGPPAGDVERDAVRPAGRRLHVGHAVPRGQRAGERFGGHVLRDVQIVA